MENMILCLDWKLMKNGLKFRIIVSFKNGGVTMWEILRKVNINNKEYDQKVYGCRTKEEAEEKIKTYDEDGLFIKEYI